MDVHGLVRVSLPAGVCAVRRKALAVEQVRADYQNKEMKDGRLEG